MTSFDIIEQLSLSLSLLQLYIVGCTADATSDQSKNSARWKRDGPHFLRLLTRYCLPAAAAASCLIGCCRRNSSFRCTNPRERTPIYAWPSTDIFPPSLSSYGISIPIYLLCIRRSIAIYTLYVCMTKTNLRSIFFSIGIPLFFFIYTVFPLLHTATSVKCIVSGGNRRSRLLYIYIPIYTRVCRESDKKERDCRAHLFFGIYGRAKADIRLYFVKNKNNSIVYTCSISIFSLQRGIRTRDRCANIKFILYPPASEQLEACAKRFSIKLLKNI